MSPPTENSVLPQRIGALALVAIGLFFIWRSIADLPFGAVDNPGPAIMPLGLASLLVIFAVWSLLAGAVAATQEADSGEAGQRAPQQSDLFHAVLIVAGIGAAAIAFGVIGYRLTVLGLLMFFLGVVERKPIVVVLLVSFGLSFGSFALFDRVLKVPLPAGPWGF